MSFLVINPGSTSQKLTVFNGERRFHYKYLKGEKGFLNSGGKSLKTSLQIINDFLSQEQALDVMGKDLIKKIAIRYVHGGELFKKPVKATKSNIKKLKGLDHLAPLHNPCSRKVVESCFKKYKKTPIIMVFDTSFHKTIPDLNSRYTFPKKISQKDIKKFGFHGIANASIVRQLQKAKILKKRTVICHLGGGCSVTALKNGVSIDTSMGFSPLGGVTMPSRIGDVDPGALLEILSQKKMSIEKLQDQLYNYSGIRALVGESDVERIVNKARVGSKSHQFALQYFCTKIAKKITECIVSLDGIDQLIFTGGIGQNSFEVREEVCKKLRPFGAKMNSKKNQKVGAGKKFCTRFSRIELRWMEVDEAMEMLEVLKMS